MRLDHLLSREFAAVATHAANDRQPNDGSSVCPPHDSGVKPLTTGSGWWLMYLHKCRLWQVIITSGRGSDEDTTPHPPARAERGWGDREDTMSRRWMPRRGVPTKDVT